MFFVQFSQALKIYQPFVLIQLFINTHTYTRLSNRKVTRMTEFLLTSKPQCFVVSYATDCARKTQLCLPYSGTEQ